MRKQLLIIGIITLFVCVGLSGCDGNNPLSKNPVTISEVMLHPERYVNKTITINGEYAPEIVNQSYNPGSVNYMDAVVTGDGFIILDFSKITKPGVVTGNLYSFTGKLVWHGKTGYVSFEYWLEVTNVESIS